MTDSITRRDFINGVAIVAGGLGLGRDALALDRQADTAGYPPARTGLRGSHAGSYDVAHSLRDGVRVDYSGVVADEHVDTVIVGAGLSGLAAAHFLCRRDPHARILLLDTNDDFGGHAKRNEFEVDGRLLIGYGGTQSIDGPRHKYSKVARGLLEDLGIHIDRFRKAYDSTPFERLGLTRAVFFKKERFGVDRLVRQHWGAWDDFDEAVPAGQENRLKAYIDELPVGSSARAKLLEMYTSGRDVLAGLSTAECERLLGSMSCEAFLRRYWDADDEVISVLQTRTHGLWAVGIDAVPALYTLALPGFRGLRVRDPEEVTEPYIYHFPDGNASIARLLVRRLVPGAIGGHSMDDIVTARVDYAALDRPGAPVAIRLSSTAVAVRNTGAGVDLTYVQAGRARRVTAGHAILACYQAMVPYLTEGEISAPQAEAMHANVRAPLIYVTLAARNWQAWKNLGVAHITNPGGRYEAYLDYPVSLGSYRFARQPSEPICVHLEHTPCQPGSGLDMRDQYRAGRAWLYGATFADLEADIRDEMTRMLGPGGFDFDRDIAAITVNRWPHGYAYTPTPLYDPPGEQAARRALACRPIGRISIAGSDAGWEAYSHVAIDEAYRAVQEVARRDAPA